MGATFQTVDIPEDMKEQAQEYHEKMMETVVEMDDDILEAYLEVGASNIQGVDMWTWLGSCLLCRVCLQYPARHPGSTP